MLLPEGKVSVRLHRPPRVANAGAALHGTTGLHDTFLLPDLWQLHLYAYSGELTLGGLHHPIRPGHISLVPPGETVSFRYLGRSEHLFVHLRLDPAGGAQTVPVMQDAGEQAEPLAELLRRAVAAAPSRPEQAAAEVWAALWRIAQLPRPSPGGRHLAVVRAMDFIEARLAEPVTVPQIARHADVSHNQLTRLFRADTGSTVVAYLRRRRLARAEHLLRRTTLPIPAIAASVGIPDLQAFNKSCRRELGASPRAVRNYPQTTSVRGISTMLIREPSSPDT
ncbi:hypothetical protein Rhe02_72420 [Rhizocola hellebori]|uniref:HTH araC/xylS-type domain-containing protein n=1 Tax=Rhizocola hellebori TaxID=1392758 RepID=A0A8J3VJX7_9ACTN|nr:helix-turn-helix domain-containing protein [Rhizocola hellebori]GIH09175.1 hypothetical protein Rhe02_72420 [Rhizocola hellebori]